MTISIVIAGVVFQFLTTGTKSFKRGSDRLDLVQTYSGVIERLKREVREASFNIEVSGNKRLKFTKFAVDPTTGLPVDNNPADGFFDETEHIIYEVVTVGSGEKERKQLIRKISGAEKVICRSLEEATFKLEIIKLQRKEGDRNPTRIPSIHIHLKIKIAGKVTDIKTVIIPRYISNWAKDPSWVTNVRGQTLKYVY